MARQHQRRVKAKSGMIGVTAAKGMAA